MGNIKKKPTYKEKLKSERLYKKKLIKKGNILLKEVCLKQNGIRCELCNGTFKATAHHYYYRSDSPHLIYEPLNFITLCAKCHSRLHFRDPKIVEAQIVAKRGKAWLNKLTRKRKNAPQGTFKTTLWFEAELKKLKKILE